MRNISVVLHDLFEQFRQQAETENQNGHQRTACAKIEQCQYFRKSSYAETDNRKRQQQSAYQYKYFERIIV